jgi:hypothetical protein
LEPEKLSLADKAGIAAIVTLLFAELLLIASSGTLH